MGIFESLKKGLGLGRKPKSTGHVLAGPNNGSSSGLASSNSKTLTDEEKDEQRKMRLNAATQRGQQWDKRCATGGSKTVKEDSNSSTAIEEELHPDTVALIERAKEREKQIIRDMGYDPFKPIMASTLNTGVTQHADPSSQQNTQSESRTSASVEEDVVELLDEAFALMISLNNVEGATGNSELVDGLIQTALKMLINLRDAPSEVKFRTIRLNNNAFQSKVVSVPGGLQIFLAAGFKIITQGGDSDGGSPKSSEKYLSHNVSETGLVRLRMTIQRLQLIKDEL